MKQDRDCSRRIPVKDRFVLVTLLLIVADVLSIITCACAVAFMCGYSGIA